MMLTQDAARELVADRLRALQAAYSPGPRPALSRRFRLAVATDSAGRTRAGPGWRPATADMHHAGARYRCRAWR